LNQVVTIVVPVFAFVAFGWLSARTKFLGRDVERGLGAFALWVAIPSLLFRLMATAEFPDEPALGLTIAFFGAAGGAWLLSSLVARALGRPPGTSASFAMGGTFGNTVMMGIPLSLATFGDAAVFPLALVTATHAPVFWLLSTVQYEWFGGKQDTNLAEISRNLIVVLAKNPVVMAIIAGSLWRQTGLGLHSLFDSVITQAGQAAIPCALFAMGMSLASYGLKGELRAAPALTLIKLVIMPAIAYVIAFHIFDVPPMWGGTIVLLAAVPTGLNAYLFAAKYECGVASVSGTIALSTLVSILTLSVVIAFLGPG
jgi:malonate transporter